MTRSQRVTRSERDPPGDVAEKTATGATKKARAKSHMKKTQPRSGACVDPASLHATENHADGRAISAAGALGVYSRAQCQSGGVAASDSCRRLGRRRLTQFPHVARG